MKLKRIIIVFSILVFLFLNRILNTNLNNYIIKDNSGDLETWNTSLSEKQLLDYYAENNIAPANPPENSSKRILEGNVSSHLSNKYPNYTNWKKTSNIRYVSDIYGGNPLEIDEDDYYIQQAKKNAGKECKYIGCGPLSLISQFDYLGRYAGYGSIPCKQSELNELKNAPMKTKLATEIFENTNTIASDSILGQLFGKNEDDGTFTFPMDAIAASRKVLKKHNLAILKTREVKDSDGNITKETYYDNDSLILVKGDSIPSLSLFSTKIDNLKKSIDKGMPVIWWTTKNAGEFSNHYMNIYGYEYWRGYDSSGNTKTHLMFILRLNWGTDPIYMDSDLLNAINGGFIFFEETHTKTLIRPEDYSCSSQYNFNEKSSVVFSSVGNKVYTNYLRTAYVNRYDSTNTNVIDKQLSLSSRRENAGKAYIEYDFSDPIEWMYLEASFWSGNEGINTFNAKAVLEIYEGGSWIVKYDFLNNDLSKDVDNKSEVILHFNKKVSHFRIYVESDYPEGTRNKGRLVIGNIMAVNELLDS